MIYPQVTKSKGCSCSMKICELPNWAERHGLTWQELLWLWMDILSQFPSNVLPALLLFLWSIPAAGFCIFSPLLRVPVRDVTNHKRSWLSVNWVKVGKAHLGSHHSLPRLLFTKSDKTFTSLIIQDRCVDFCQGTSPGWRDEPCHLHVACAT